MLLQGGRGKALDAAAEHANMDGNGDCPLHAGQQREVSTVSANQHSTLVIGCRMRCASGSRESPRAWRGRRCWHNRSAQKGQHYTFIKTTPGCAGSPWCRRGGLASRRHGGPTIPAGCEEVALARQVHANCIRLWIEFTAWMADPDKVTDSFLDGVKAIADAGMKVMPCLFNRWHDARFDYGGRIPRTYLPTGGRS